MKETNQIKLPVLVTVSLCFCVVAVGAGLMFQEATEPLPQTIAEEVEKPTEIYIPKESQSVTSPQTESFAAEISDDAGDAPDVPEDVEAGATTSQALGASDPLAFIFPIDGEVVMPYSVETAIFDSTLAQYRTNDSVSLAAVAGADVYAAEDGVVEEIQKDEQSGTSLVIAHADGWLTTYSQLAADISVSVGETVSKGQKIGSVGEPTKYTIALGEHLEFAMEQDGQTKDPEDVVAE